MHFKYRGKLFPALILAVIIAGALSLRIRGTDFGLEVKGSWHPNELIEQGLRVAAGNPDPEWYSYPAFRIYLLALADSAWYMVNSAVSSDGTHPTSGSAGHETDILSYYRNNRDKLFLAGRIENASIGAFFMPLLMFLIILRISKSYYTALLGSILAALNPVMVREAHYATVDTLLLVTSTAALAASLTVPDKPILKNYLLTGILAGLSASTKQSGVPVFLLLPVACTLSCIGSQHPTSQKSEIVIRKSLLMLFAGFSVGIAAFVLTSPYFTIQLLTGHSRFPTHLASVAGIAADSNRPLFERFQYYSLFSSYREFLKIFISGSGLIFSILTGAGIIAVTVVPDKKRSLVLFWLLIGFFLTGGLAVQTPRYVMTTIPAAIILTTLFIDFLYRITLRKAGMIPATLLSIIIAGSVIASFGASSMQTVRELSGKDTRETATRFLAETLPPGAKVLVEGPGETGPSIPPGETTRYYAPDFNPGAVHLPEEKILPVRNVRDCQVMGIRYVVTSSLKNSRKHQELERSIISEPGVTLEAWIHPPEKVAEDPLRAYGFHNPDIHIYRLPMLPSKSPENCTAYRILSGPFTPLGNGIFRCRLPLPVEDRGFLWRKNLIVIPFDNDKPFKPFTHFSRSEHPDELERDVVSYLNRGEYAEGNGMLYLCTLSGGNPATDGHRYTFVLVDNYVVLYNELLVWIAENFNKETRFVFDYMHLFRSSQLIKCPGREIKYPSSDDLDEFNEKCRESGADYLILTEPAFYFHTTLYSPYLDFSCSRGFSDCPGDALPGWTPALRDHHIKSRFIVFRPAEYQEKG